MSADPHPRPLSRRERGGPRPLRRWVGVLIGAALLGAALVVVARQHEMLGPAWEAIRRPAPAYVLVLVGGVCANVVLTGLLYSVLISRYGRVGLLEMQALIAAATLLNFLPLRPGLFGRIAYHKASNAIPAVASLKTVAQAVLLSLAVAGYVAIALVVAARCGPPLRVLVGLPVVLLAVAALLRPVRLWAVAALVRYLEVIVWSLRYHAAFALVGSPIGAESALAFACLSLIAMLVPVVGNGLGVREWVIGMAAPLLTPYVLELGLGADLVNRAAELVVVLVLGLAGMGWLWKKKSDEATKRQRASQPPTPGSADS